MTASRRRRALLTDGARLAALLAAAATWPQSAHAQAPSPAYPQPAFDADTLADVARALGAATPAASREVTLTAPDIAEDGAGVPIGVQTALPGVRRLLILVEKNPNLLSAVFDVGDAVDAQIATRIKMAQTSNVYGVAILADGRALYARKAVSVTLGGCGG